MVLTPRGRIIDIRNIDMFDNNLALSRKYAPKCAHLRVYISAPQRTRSKPEQNPSVRTLILTHGACLRNLKLNG